MSPQNSDAIIPATAERAIWKHTLDFPSTGVLLRDEDRILCAATHGGRATIWVEHVNPTRFPGGDVPTRIVRVVRTGEGPSAGDQYIGTCHNVGGAGSVFHLYLAPKSGPAPGTI